MPFFDRFRGRAAENREYEDIPCRFVVGRPVEHSLRDVERGRLQNILSVGIVNPFGPTFTILAVEGRFQQGSDLPVWSIMLNPFKQTAERVGTLKVNRGVWPSDITEAAHMYFDTLGKHCPTVLLPAGPLSRDDGQALCTEYLTCCLDGSSVLDGVRRFPGNPADRVSAEMERAASAFAAARSGMGRQESSNPLHPDEAQELARRLLHANNQKQELAAFFFAWKGAIDFQRSSGNRIKSMSRNEFEKWFSRIAATSQVPGLGI